MILGEDNFPLDAGHLEGIVTLKSTHNNSGKYAVL